MTRRDNQREHKQQKTKEVMEKKKDTSHKYWLTVERDRGRASETTAGC